MGLGLALRNILSAEKPTNAAKTIEIQKVGKRLEILAPNAAPTKIPGASHRTTFQSTAPRLLCALTEESDVKRIVEREVAIAACTTTVSGTPAIDKISVRKGVRTMPPPIPSRPARYPVQAPSTKRAAMSSSDIAGVFNEVIHDVAPVMFLNGRYGEAVAAGKHEHALKFRGGS